MDKGEHGQVIVLVIGLSLLAFAVAGVAVDGTRAFLARRTLQNAADGSALAGAGQVDAAAFYGSGGRELRLEPSAARTTARSWLGRRGIPARASVVATEEGVRVVLTAEVETTFLSLVGISSVSVAAEALARPQSGAVPSAVGPGAWKCLDCPGAAPLTR